MAADRLLTVAEVLALLRISRTGLWRLTASGKLPSVRVGERSLRFRERDLVGFVDAASCRGQDGVAREPGRKRVMGSGREKSSPQMVAPLGS